MAVAYRTEYQMGEDSGDVPSVVPKDSAHALRKPPQSGEGTPAKDER